MRIRATILISVLFLILVIFASFHCAYRVPLNALPAKFEGVYFLHLRKKERNHYYIHIENAPREIQASVYVKDDNELRKVGTYKLNAYRIIRFRKPNHGWSPSDEVLKIKFPVMNDPIDLWIGEGRETYLVSLHQEGCIDGKYHSGVILRSTGQSVKDPSYKEGITGSRSFNGVARLMDKLENQQVGVE